MNFNIDLGKWVTDMLDKYEQSPRVRRLIHMILFIILLFAIASLINAIKWW